jgi:hypothetical protein
MQNNRNENGPDYQRAKSDKSVKFMWKVEPFPIMYTYIECTKKNQFSTQILGGPDTLLPPVQSLMGSGSPVARWTNLCFESVTTRNLWNGNFLVLTSQWSTRKITIVLVTVKNRSKNEKPKNLNFELFRYFKAGFLQPWIYHATPMPLNL